jgi:hypothetical protein
MDRLVARTIRASNDFTTHSAIAADLTDDIPLTQYRRAFTAWAEDFADIKRTQVRFTTYDCKSRATFFCRF